MPKMTVRGLSQFGLSQCGFSHRGSRERRTTTPSSLRSLSLASAAALVALAGQAGAQDFAQASPTERQASGILWRALGETATSVTPHVVPASLDVERTLAGLVPEQVCVVRLSRVPTQDDRAFLRAQGLLLLGVLSSDSFYARLDAAAQVGTLARSGLVAGAEAMQTTWKIEPRLLRLRAGEDLALWGRDGAPQAARPQAPNAELAVPVSVLLHEDVDAKAFVAQVSNLAVGGAAGVQALQTLPLLSMQLRLADLEALATLADVQWIEPALPALTSNNFENRALTGANIAQASPFNLDGSGVSVFVFDSGLVLSTHVAMSGRVQVTETGTDDIDFHATHCAGTVAGDGDPDANRTHKGMAPNASILSAGVSIGSGSGWLYTNPTDIEADYIAAFNAGASLTTNSIGTNVEFNGFDCTWHGNYGAVSALLDRLVVGSQASFNEGEPSRIVWAAGNERGGSRCGANNPGFRKLAPPAPTKNILLVGAVNADAGAQGDTIATFSSFGPTDDGRVKPDVVAPGCQVGGDQGITSASTGSNTSYTTLCGTSMACPTVAGLSALLIQDMRAQFPGISDPRNSTLRAIFASTAVDRGNPGPDYQFGFGSVRIMPALELARAANFREASIVQGQVLTFEVLVPEGTPSTRITLAWDDVPGNPAIIPQLVNNLDLEVIDPQGVRRGVWRLDPANPGTPAVRVDGEAAPTDTVNNIEQVQIDTPTPGIYSVRVVGTSVPTGPGPGGTGEQSFSIASNSQLRSLGGVPLVFMAPRQLAPELTPAGETTPVRVAITAFADTLEAGSVRLNYRLAPDAPVQSIAMTTTDDRVFEANLPSFACGDRPRYWFEARGVSSGIATLPAQTQAANTFATAIGTYELVRLDPLETLTGFTVSGNALTGRWTNMDPSRTASLDNTITFQPADDASENGTRAWVTDGRAGSSAQLFDVDNGSTTITSAPIDLANTNAARVGYSRWFYSYNGGSPLRIEASLDGNAWSTVEAVQPSDTQNARGGWRTSDFSVSAVLGVANPPSVRLRITAQDGSPTDGLVEALFDDLRVLSVECNAPSCDSIDFNNDGLFPSDDDLVTFLSTLAGTPCPACNDIDFNNDGLFPSDDDLVAFLRVLAGSDC
jgi:hypothetical protein